MSEDIGNVKTVVSYMYSGVPNTHCSYSMKVFDFKVDTAERWNVMMSELMEAHPDAKNSIIVLFVKELRCC
jgi:hypothetical protein